jgi:hypothetical protein
MAWCSAPRAASNTQVTERLAQAGIISPTHKWTEGRAPVWGSEFTSKDAALQGVGEIAGRLNVKLCDLRGGDW